MSDISSHQGRRLSDVVTLPFDLVFDDPVQVGGSEDARLAAFRRARDEIARRVQMFLLAHHVGEQSQRSHDA